MWFVMCIYYIWTRENISIFYVLSSYGSAESGRTCDMCANYEKQLVAEQAAADAARDRASKLDHALKLVNNIVYLLITYFIK